MVVLSRTPPDRVAAELWVLSPDGIVPKTSAGWVGLAHARRAALGHRGGPDGALERLREQLPERYLLVADVDQILEHARLLGRLRPAAQPMNESAWPLRRA